MKLIASFRVSGNPVSKARARVGQQGAWTPSQVTAAEDRIRWQFLQDCKGVEVNHRARYRVMLAFVASDLVHRDVDNLAKLVLDALNGHVWKDDWQIDELSIRRVFVEDPARAATMVEIYEIPPPAWWALRAKRRRVKTEKRNR